MCCSLDRREFLGLSAGVLAGLGLPAAAGAAGAAPAGGEAERWDPTRPYSVRRETLRVLPILHYAVPRPREKASWKSWGGVQGDEAAAREAERIAGELRDLAGRAGFPLEVLPVAKARAPEEASRARETPHDVVIVYPATGGGDLLRAAAAEGGRTLVFARHRSGPVYYWYEALSTRYLQVDVTGGSTAAQGTVPAAAGNSRPDSWAGGLSVDDVVVDDIEELLWRLRSLAGVKDFLGSRVVALGGAGGKYAPEAPKVARERFGLEIIETGYEDLGRRIAAARADAARMERADADAARYLALPGTTLRTERRFVAGSFLLRGIFRDLLREAGASIFTIGSCMGTILPMADTTACLTLSLLNDEGAVAFCESDFVIVPAGILLQRIAGTPVFLHNSTFPHGGVVTCAHCTCPRRMDGARYEPALVLTHYESEFGAAPKVEFPLGQEVTCLDPEYATGRWVGLLGTVEANPSYEICRSQQDLRVRGDWRKLLGEARDSHWVMAYGDWRREAGYASRRIGVRWEQV
jgi:L-fucose isomerase-like protein